MKKWAYLSVGSFVLAMICIYSSFNKIPDRSNFGSNIDAFGIIGSIAAILGLFFFILYKQVGNNNE